MGSDPSTGVRGKLCDDDTLPADEYSFPRDGGPDSLLIWLGDGPGLPLILSCEYLASPFASIVALIPFDKFLSSKRSESDGRLRR